MKVAVFGATGGTGRAAVEQALARGDEVVVLARRPERLGISHARLRVVTGDAYDAAAVAGVLRGQEAVIDSLGTRPWKHTDVCSRGTVNIIAGMKEHGVKRLVCVSSLMVADSYPYASLFWRWFFMPILRRALADKAVMEQAIRDSGLEWVIARPVILTNGAPRGGVRAVVDGSIHGGFIRRADVAAFCLAQVSSDKWLRQAPVIAT